MSGRKQHYIPQALLRGFKATQKRGKHTQVYVYYADRSPYLSSTEGVAAQRNFYSELSSSGQRTLDDRITDYEQRLTSLLVQLRAAPSGSKVDSSVAAELVSHLAMRSAFLRQTFEFGLQETIASAGRFFMDTASARSRLGIDQHGPTPELSDAVDNAVQELSPRIPLELPKPLLRHILRTLMREGFDAIHAEHIAPQLATALDQLTNALPTMVRSGHVKALESSFVQQPRAKLLADLNWIVLAVPEANLILPDCVVMSSGHSVEIACAPYLIDGDEVWENILLPLDASHVLVGSRSINSPIAIDQINRHAAACSLEFFVSPQANDDTLLLASHIGQRSRSSIAALVRGAVEAFDVGATKELLSSDQAVTELLPIETHGPPAPSNLMHPYSVTFSGNDQATAEAIARVVGMVVGACAPYLPLGKLESITFTHDYAATLRNLDRGFQARIPLEGTETESKIGIAMAPLVIRDGKIRSCIVMRAWLGEALLQPGDNDTFQFALYTLGSMLARVALADFTDTALPGVLLQPMADAWNALFFEHIHAAISNYFSARIAAELFPQANNSHRELFLAALESANENIPKERLAYRKHANLNAFLDVSTRSLGDVLVHSASMLGHHDGMGQDGLEEDEHLLSILRTTGLEQWIRIYRQDLATVFKRRGQWTSIEEFTVLVTHLERLMWQFMIFPWRTDTGAVQVEIPLFVDLPALLAMTEVNQSASTNNDRGHSVKRS